MHIHILGICGTFMGGLAVIAKHTGHRVTGCDSAVYPPMSTQLEAQGIELIEGYGADQIDLRADAFVIGNVVTRGNPLMEEILNRGLPYVSGPQWLADQILRDRWVLAVAGTHGKTTTASMLAWILECAGSSPSYLIGGVPRNFEISARLVAKSPGGGAPSDPLFVVEADEYDTAFFDKRSKFVHYRPRTAILTNLEFDHADIFPDLAAIETQFHHLVRTIPSQGLLVVNGRDRSIRRVLDRGCWTPVEYFGVEAGWEARSNESGFVVLLGREPQGTVKWDLLGDHNAENALAAIAAARSVGVEPPPAIEALGRFKSVRRRMEIRGVVRGITVYDDFAHHPSSIDATLAGLRRKVGNARILAVLEPRSNSMKMGIWADALGPSLRQADQVFCYTANLGWDAEAPLRSSPDRVVTSDNLSHLIDAVTQSAHAGDHVVIMSNGAFGGIQEKLLQALGGSTHQSPLETEMSLAPARNP